MWALRTVTIFLPFLQAYLFFGASSNIVIGNISPNDLQNLRKRVARRRRPPIHLVAKFEDWRLSEGRRLHSGKQVMGTRSWLQNTRPAYVRPAKAKPDTPFT